MGKKSWSIVDGYRPPMKKGDADNYQGHECVLVLNRTEKDAHCLIDIYFEDQTRHIKHIKATVGRLSAKTFSIVGDEIDSEWKYFNPASLMKKGIPENEIFAVRFMSDIPIVISNQDHKADYYAN